MSVRSVPPSSVPATGAAGRPVRGQATELPAPRVSATSGELQNPREWVGAGAQDPLEQAVKGANETLASIDSELHFAIDEDTGRTIVKVVVKATGEVIRQLPTEEALEVAKALKSLASGLLLNEKV